MKSQKNIKHLLSGFKSLALCQIEKEAMDPERSLGNPAQWADILEVVPALVCGPC